MLLAAGVLLVMLVLAFGGTAHAGTISGQVYGNNEGSVALSGAVVTVRVNALDFRFDAEHPERNIIGKAVTNKWGGYVLFSQRIYPGMWVEVSARGSGYISVTQWGRTGWWTRVDFARGSRAGDTRLPYDTGQIPPLPFDW